MNQVVRILSLAMLSTLAVGQEPASGAGNAAAPPAPKSSPAAEVPPTAIVLRIPGVCPPAPKTAAKSAAVRCETVVTRAEFDRFSSVVSPNLPPAQRRTLAQRYAEVLGLATRAQRESMDKDPQVQEQLRVARLQILATAYNRALQKRFSNPTEAEVQKYYAENGARFEEVTVQRLYIPKPVPKEGEAADESTAKALAESLRARAAAGEGFETLQAEAMKATRDEEGATAPPTDLGDRRRGSLPQGHEHSVFEAPVGQVTPVYEEPSGYFVYKVVAKQKLPLADVRGEIVNSISSQKLNDAMESARTSVKPVFNDAYFPEKPAAPPSGPPAPAKPGSAESQENQPPEKPNGE